MRPETYLILLHPRVITVCKEIYLILLHPRVIPICKETYIILFHLRVITICKETYLILFHSRVITICKKTYLILLHPRVITIRKENTVSTSPVNAYMKEKNVKWYYTVLKTDSFFSRNSSQAFFLLRSSILNMPDIYVSSILDCVLASFINLTQPRFIWEKVS